MEQQERLSRQEQAQQTKQRIFDAAYALLQQKDFKDITISEIVTRAGVSTGAFYLYYASKLDVYYQTYVLADSYFLHTVAPLTTEGTALERLLTYFDHYAYYNAEYSNIKLTKLLYNGDNRCFLRTDDGMHTVLSGIVRSGLASGELDAAMTEDEICRFFMYAARGLVYDWCISDGAEDLRALMRGYILRLYRSVKS